MKTFLLALAPISLLFSCSLKERLEETFESGPFVGVAFENCPTAEEGPSRKLGDDFEFLIYGDIKRENRPIIRIVNLKSKDNYCRFLDEPKDDDILQITGLSKFTHSPINGSYVSTGEVLTRSGKRSIIIKISAKGSFSYSILKKKW